MAVNTFYGTLTVSAGSTAADPDEVTIHTAPGTLLIVRLNSPEGPRGVVSLYLRHQTRQVAPTPPEVWTNFDRLTLDYPLTLPLPVNETDLTLVGFAPYANYDHDINVEALVDTSESQPQPQTPQSLLSRLTSALGG
jgi:hypothetical protein